MIKPSVFLTGLFLLLAGCGKDNSGNNFEPLNLDAAEISEGAPASVEKISEYDLLYNPEGYSPTEYIIAHGIEITVPESVYKVDPNWLPDTVFAWHYKISDLAVQGAGTMIRTVTMEDGAVSGGTYDFSKAPRNMIIIFEDRSLGYMAQSSKYAG